MADFPPAGPGGGGGVPGPPGPVDPVVIDRTIHNADTGVIDWAGFSIDVGSLTFTNEAGTGRIVNNEAAPGNPAETLISWPQTTLNAPLNIAGQTIGFVMINAAGGLFQQNTPPTPQQRRENIVLGLWATGDNITITSLQDQVGSSVSKYQTAMDALRSIGLLKGGLVVSGNGANLSIDISAGTLFAPGINYNNDKSNPNILALAGAVLKPFFEATQTGILPGGTVTAIDPTLSDVGGVVTAIPGSANQATNQLVFQFPSGNVIVLLGQTIHATLDDAIQESDKESIIIPPEIRSQGILIGVISVRKGAINFQLDTDARFLSTGLTGSLAGGASGIPVGTLQNIYDNSAQPQITTSPGSGPLQIKQGTGSDADTVLEVLNDAGEVKFSVDGNGVISPPVAAAPNHRFTVLDGDNIVAGDDIIGCGDIGGPFTLFLSTAALIKGKSYTINDEAGTAATNNININRIAPAAINVLLSSVSIITNFGSVTIYNDGDNWFTR